MLLNIDHSATDQIVTDGFAFFKQALTGDSLENLREIVNACLCKIDRSTEKRVHWSPLFSKSDNAATDLFTSPILRSLAEQTTGREVFCVMVDATRATGSTDCHSDAQDWELGGLRINFYLDSLAPGAGALRLFPGSHKKEIWEQLDQCPSHIENRTSMCCGVEPGDAIAMDLRLWHDVQSDETTMREFASVFFYTFPKTHEEIEAVRVSARRNRKALKVFGASDEAFTDFAASNSLSANWANALFEYGFLEKI